MEEKIFTFIEDQIGHKFKNRDLLRQAFVRRSYSQENGGENNEVLEFIGDKRWTLRLSDYLLENMGIWQMAILLIRQSFLYILLI